MLGKLLLAFIVVPLVEFFLLVWIADRTSVFATIALVIVTGIIGSVLARAEGLRAWRRFRTATAEGRMPSEEIQDGLAIVFAAALLLTPGLLTDTVGFLLLIPQTRRMFRRWVAKQFKSHVKVTVVDAVSSSSFTGPFRSRDGKTVDATGWSNVKEDDDQPVTRQAM